MNSGTPTSAITDWLDPLIESWRTSRFSRWLFQHRGPESEALLYHRRIFILPSRPGVIFGLMMPGILFGFGKHVLGRTTFKFRQFVWAAFQ
jgi:hypothetical protein